MSERKPKTRIRSTDFGWQVDQHIAPFIWWPMGRWIHQDWWAPYSFKTATDAMRFVETAFPDAALAKTGATP